MTDPISMTKCPTGEALAALIARHSEAETNRSVLEHIAACAGCRKIALTALDLRAAGNSVVTEARGSKKRFTRRVALTTIAVLAAAAIVIGLRRPVEQWLLDRASGIPALSALAEEMAYRPIEARLSNLTFSPLNSVSRGVGKKPPLRLSALAGRIHDRAMREPVTRNLQAMGVAHLFLGNYDEAIASFQQALGAETGADDIGESLPRAKNPELLIDIAAAYHARGSHANHPADFVAAIDVADRAWTLSKLPEVAWNRAVAVQSLHLREDAIRAWNDYLAVDDSSLWADQARQRLAALRATSPSDLWERIAATLRASALSGDRQTLRNAVDRFPQQTRMYAEEELLPAWAAATLRRDVATSDAHLTALRVIGEALYAAGGEAIVRDIALAVVREGAAAAPACLAYAEAQKVHRAQRMNEAYPLWVDVTAKLHARGIPLWSRAAVFEATADYYRGHSDAAARRVSPVADDRSLGDRFPSVRAQALWLRGLIRCSSGRQGEGIRDYREALRLFMAVREAENIASIHNRLATNMEYIGKRDEAWFHRSEALRILGRQGKSSRMQPLLVDAARGASESGFVFASLRFHDALVRVARPDHVLLCDALRSRSLARWKANLADAAVTDLRASIEEEGKVGDQSMRERLAANRRSVEATIYRTTQPRLAIASATDAIAFYTRVGNHLRISEVFVDRAMAYAASADVALAARDLEAALAALERQRSNLATPEHRRAFLEHRRSVFEAGLEFFVARGDYAAAFSFAEISRARTLLDSVTGSTNAAPLTSADVVAEMPSETTLIAYAVLPKRLVIWTVRRDGIVGQVLNVSRARIADLVARMASACRSRHELQCRAMSVALNDLLIASVQSGLTRDLVIVPDSVLYDVAFAGLAQQSARGYLIERHQLTMAPSATMFIRSTRRSSAVNERSPALLIGNPRFDLNAMPVLTDLPRAAAEVRDIGRFYAAATVSTGISATKRQFLAAADRGMFIHFAGHVIDDQDRSERSALVLASTKNDDGLLYVEEIVRRQWTSVPLIVLSSCGTTRHLEGTDGPLGMARAFLLAGVPVVVAALTPADDDTTHHFFVLFHRELSKGSGAARALRAAQVQMLRSPDIHMRTPAAWSSFVVVV